MTLPCLHRPTTHQDKAMNHATQEPKSMQLAVELDRWRLDSRTVNFMVGGPEGLAPEVCARADQRWSLSPLTLPHPLVRILIGEQLYRAWTVLSGHPYHK